MVFTPQPRRLRGGPPLMRNVVGNSILDAGSSADYGYTRVRRKRARKRLTYGEFSCLWVTQRGLSVLKSNIPRWL